jgi:hypothetical protein
MKRIKDFLLEIIERVSSQIHVWAWNKRWNKGNRKDEFKK